MKISVSIDDHLQNKKDKGLIECDVEAKLHATSLTKASQNSTVRHNIQSDTSLDMRILQE